MKADPTHVRPRKIPVRGDDRTYNKKYGEEKRGAPTKNSLRLSV